MKRPSTLFPSRVLLCSAAVTRLVEQFGNMTSGSRLTSRGGFMPPKIQGLCPLIQMFDMPVSLAFYRDLLGFEVVQQAPSGDQCGWAWLKLGDAELMLNTRYEADERPTAPDPARIVAHDDTCFYFGAPDVDAMYGYLREKDIDVSQPAVAPYGMKHAVFKRSRWLRNLFSMAVDLTPPRGLPQVRLHPRLTLADPC